MDLFKFVIDFFLHLDKYLSLIIDAVGIWTYAVLFLVIFVETGLVIMPFLPGDSLLFAAGAFSALNPGGEIFSLNVNLLFGLLAVAAVLGDTVNYWIGHFVGPKVFSEGSRFLKKEHLDKTQAFYEKHGGKTILLARFVPIIRTFAPFVAGIGQMKYSYFLTYNVVGGVLWTGLFLYAGYFFGSQPFVEENFSLVIFGIIFVSLLPPIIEALKERSKSKKELAKESASE
ncbi:MAG: DedA family protein [Anaerolineaceae bacterium]|nr:DedA family protein [Anaerolineaceae bacterium]